MSPDRWQPDRSDPPPPWALPPMKTALARGFRGLCPSCGKGHIFNGFLKVVTECRNCGAPLGLARADDAPPYFTILAVGHIVVPLVVVVEQLLSPPLWVQFAIWPAVTVALSLLLLPRIKGAVLGVAMALGVTQRAAEDTPDN